MQIRVVIECPKTLVDEIVEAVVYRADTSGGFQLSDALLLVATFKFKFKVHGSDVLVVVTNILDTISQVVVRHARAIPLVLNKLPQVISNSLFPVLYRKFPHVFLGVDLFLGMINLWLREVHDAFYFSTELFIRSLIILDVESLYLFGESFLFFVPDLFDIAGSLVIQAVNVRVA